MREHLLCLLFKGYPLRSLPRLLMVLKVVFVLTVARSNLTRVTLHSVFKFLLGGKPDVFLIHFRNEVWVFLILLVERQLHVLIRVNERHLVPVLDPWHDDIVLRGSLIREALAYDNFLSQGVQLDKVVLGLLGVHYLLLLKGFDPLILLLVL